MELVSHKSFNSWKWQRDRRRLVRERAGCQGNVRGRAMFSSIRLCHSKILTKTLSRQCFLNFDCLTLQLGPAFNIAIHRSHIYALSRKICCIVKEVCACLIFKAGVFNFCGISLCSSRFRGLQHLIGVSEQAPKPRPSFPAKIFFWSVRLGSTSNPSSRLRTSAVPLVPAAGGRDNQQVEL